MAAVEYTFIIAIFKHKRNRKFYFLLSPLAGKRDIVVTIFFQCMCVRPWVSSSVCLSGFVRTCPHHNLYNNAWTSKQFGTVVALEEEKCH